MTTGFVPGPPGPRAAIPMVHKSVLLGGFADFLPGGGRIDTTKTRDTSNTVSPTLLNPGLLMGQVTTGKKWTNSIIGLTQAAIAEGATTLTLTAAAAVELVRRIGAAGTFTLTGPPAAATDETTVRSVTVTYSAVNVVTGVVTITAISANQAEDVRLAPAATAGNIQLNVSKPDGTRVTTANIAWNATDATFLASINTALDTATGVVGGIVATAIAATDTDNGFTLTYSGVGYAGKVWPPAAVALMPTSTTITYVVPRTVAVRGAFVTNSLVGDTDGSQVPRAFVYDGYGVTLSLDVATLPSYAEWPDIPVGGKVMSAQLVNWPPDPGLRVWIAKALSTFTQGKFTFDFPYQ